MNTSLSTDLNNQFNQNKSKDINPSRQLISRDYSNMGHNNHQRNLNKDSNNKGEEDEILGIYEKFHELNDNSGKLSPADCLNFHSPISKEKDKDDELNDVFINNFENEEKIELKSDTVNNNPNNFNKIPPSSIVYSPYSYQIPSFSSSKYSDVNGFFSSSVSKTRSSFPSFQNSVNLSFPSFSTNPNNIIKEKKNSGKSRDGRGKTSMKDSEKDDGGFFWFSLVCY
jgi:hypothetical protein